MFWGDAHTVVVVPVPELEPFVLARTRHYDPAWLSPDPQFTHAHVTLLAPWVRDPTDDDLAALEAVAATTQQFAFRLSAVDQFPDGTIHVPIEPPDPLMTLMRRISTAFPTHLPYDGLFGSVDGLVPHVTLDRVSPTVDVASTQTLVGDLLPAVCRAQRLEVHRYAAHDCGVVASFGLAH